MPDSGAAGSANTAGSFSDAGIIAGLGPVLRDIMALFSIDSTEVTREQYAQWLATNPSPPQGQPTACKWKTNFTPSCEWPPGSKASHPVVCVDWCDAHAFCAAGGKRLCGKIGGGPSLWDDFKTAGVDEWFHACSAGGKTLYPYGDTYAAQACNGVDVANKGTWAAGSASACQSAASGFEKVLDMSGNVLEWQNNCQADVGQGDACRARGGSYNDGAAALTCSDGGGHFRDDRLPVLGFRCCTE
jgi:formylglycine-generating enzyme required for sulfatase activity